MHDPLPGPLPREREKNRVPLPSPPPRGRESSTRWMRWLLVSAAVIVLDLATKFWIVSVFAPGEWKAITPFFKLGLTFNTGAAFSFLADAGGWQRWFFTVVTIVISIAIVVMLRREQRNRLLAFSLALVLGGALGNLYDRMTLGHVVDFILVHAGEHMFPAFNVADSAISIGVALLIWDSLRSNAPSRAPRPVRQEKP
jgi:signal peptidase II